MKGGVSSCYQLGLFRLIRSLLLTSNMNLVVVVVVAGTVIGVKSAID